MGKGKKVENGKREDYNQRMGKDEQIHEDRSTEEKIKEKGVEEKMREITTGIDPWKITKLDA